MFIFLCLVCPRRLTLRSAGLKKGKKAPGEKLPALTPVSRQRRVWEKSRLLVKTTCHPRDRHFQFQKRGQLLIRSHDGTLSVATVRVNNPDRLPVRINPDRSPFKIQRLGKSPSFMTDSG